MRLFQLLALLAVVVLGADTALAQEFGEAASAKTWIPLSAGIGLGIAAFGGALAQGKIISAALESIARNPGAGGKMFIVWFLGVAFVESLVVYSLVISLQLVGKI